MFIKLVRIGKDAELRQVNGKAVLNVSVVYDVGYGQNKQAQWLRLALWGDRADKVASHFTKGKQLVVRVDDLQVRTFQGQNGTQATLEGTLVGFDFVSDSRRDDGGHRQDAHNTAKSNGYQPHTFADDPDLPF